MRTHKRPGDKTFNYVWGWAGTKFVPVQPLAGFSIPEGVECELWYSCKPPSAIEVRSGEWSRPGGNIPLSELPRLSLADFEGRPRTPTDPLDPTVTLIFHLWHGGPEYDASCPPGCGLLVTLTAPDSVWQVRTGLDGYCRVQVPGGRYTATIGSKGENLTLSPDEIRTIGRSVENL